MAKSRRYKSELNISHSKSLPRNASASENRTLQEDGRGESSQNSRWPSKPVQAFPHPNVAGYIDERYDPGVQERSGTHLVKSRSFYSTGGRRTRVVDDTSQVQCGASMQQSPGYGSLPRRSSTAAHYPSEFSLSPQQSSGMQDCTCSVPVARTAKGSDLAPHGVRRQQSEKNGDNIGSYNAVTRQASFGGDTNRNDVCWPTSQHDIHTQQRREVLECSSRSQNRLDNRVQNGGGTKNRPQSVPPPEHQYLSQVNSSQYDVADRPHQHSCIVDERNQCNGSSSLASSGDQEMGSQYNPGYVRNLVHSYQQTVKQPIGCGVVASSGSGNGAPPLSMSQSTKQSRPMSAGPTSIAIAQRLKNESTPMHPVNGSEPSAFRPVSNGQHSDTWHQSHDARTTGAQKFDINVCVVRPASGRLLPQPPQKDPRSIGGGRSVTPGPELVKPSPVSKRPDSQNPSKDSVYHEYGCL